MAGVWGEHWPEYMKRHGKGTPRIIRKDLEDLNQKQTQFVGTFLLALARLGSDGSRGMPQMDPAVLEEMLMLLVPWLRTMQYDNEFCLYPHCALAYIREAITQRSCPYDYDTRFVRDDATWIPIIWPYVTAECGRWVESCGFMHCGNPECSGRLTEYTPCRAVAPTTAVDDGAVILTNKCPGVHPRDPQNVVFTPTNAALIREGRALTRIRRVRIEITGNAMAIFVVTHPGCASGRMCLALSSSRTTEFVVGTYGVDKYVHVYPIHRAHSEVKYPPGFTFDAKICDAMLMVRIGERGTARIHDLMLL